MKIFEAHEKSFASRIWHAFGQLLSFYPVQDDERRERMREALEQARLIMPHVLTARR